MKAIANYVTGAGGFIGRRLMARLDPESTAAVPHLKIYEWEPKRRFQTFFFLSSYGNLAGQNNVPEIIAANVIQPMSVVNKMRTARTGEFVYVSSSSVTLPVQTPYSRAKLAAEQLLSCWDDRSRPTFIARPYSVTGVGEQPQHLIPTLIRSCLEGKSMPFFPDAVHDFIDVSDFVEGLLFLANEAEPGLYEFGSGIATSNAEVKKLVEEVTGKKANTVLRDNAGRAYDNGDWWCRTPCAGWKPKVPLVESIAQMVEAYKKQ